QFVRYYWIDILFVTVLLLAPLLAVPSYEQVAVASVYSGDNPLEQFPLVPAYERNRNLDLGSSQAAGELRFQLVQARRIHPISVQAGEEFAVILVHLDPELPALYLYVA